MDTATATSSPGSVEMSLDDDFSQSLLALNSGDDSQDVDLIADTQGGEESQDLLDDDVTQFRGPLPNEHSAGCNVRDSGTSESPVVRSGSPHQRASASPFLLPATPRRRESSASSQTSETPSVATTASKGRKGVKRRSEVLKECDSDLQTLMQAIREPIQWPTSSTSAPSQKDPVDSCMEFLGSMIKKIESEPERLRLMSVVTNLVIDKVVQLATPGEQ